MADNSAAQCILRSRLSRKLSFKPFWVVDPAFKGRIIVERWYRESVRGFHCVECSDVAGSLDPDIRRSYHGEVVAELLFFRGWMFSRMITVKVLR